jgi:hypothetical protein
MSQVQVNNSINNVNVGNTINTVNVDQNSENVLVIPQIITNVLEVVTPGPQGPQGPPGQVDQLTGSFVTTSSFNAFTSSYNTGSFTGSFIGGGSGLIGVISASYANFSSTSSFALNFNPDATASYAITASYALTANGGTGSFTGSFFGDGAGLFNIPASGIVGLNLFRIATGSVTASVDVNPNSIFLIKSGSFNFINISSSGDTTIFSNLFIIKNLVSNNPVLTVSGSIVQFATQSSEPTGPTENGSIWFTSTNFYVGLD